MNNHTSHEHFTTQVCQGLCVCARVFAYLVCVCVCLVSACVHVLLVYVSPMRTYVCVCKGESVCSRTCCKLNFCIHSYSSEDNLDSIASKRRQSGKHSV